MHPMQVWRTPFVSAEHHCGGAERRLVCWRRIGNADLVRGVSDALSVVRLIRNQQPTRGGLRGAGRGLQPVRGRVRLGPARRGRGPPRHRGGDPAHRGARHRRVREGAGAAEAGRGRDRRGGGRPGEAVRPGAPDSLPAVDAFLAGMTRLRAHRGHLITLREIRYVDLVRLDKLEKATVDGFDQVAKRDGGVPARRRGVRAVDRRIWTALLAGDREDRQGATSWRRCRRSWIDRGRA